MTVVDGFRPEGYFHLVPTVKERTLIGAAYECAQSAGFDTTSLVFSNALFTELPATHPDAIADILAQRVRAWQPSRGIMAHILITWNGRVYTAVLDGLEWHNQTTPPQILLKTISGPEPPGEESATATPDPRNARCVLS